MYGKTNHVRPGEIGGRVNFGPYACLSGPHVLTYPTTYAPAGGPSIRDQSIEISSGREKSVGIKNQLVLRYSIHQLNWARGKRYIRYLGQ